MPKIAIAHLAAATPDGIEELDNIASDYLDLEHLRRHECADHRQRRSALRQQRAERMPYRLASPAAALAPSVQH